MAYQTLNVLNFLHSNRICHRDVKPQNVLVSGGVCKLCDFGFARQLSDQTMALNSIKGSPIYLAPEIARGQTYGFSSDIWSLGVMLFELSTQHPPFIARDYIQLIKLLQNETLTVPYDNYQVFKRYPVFADFLQNCLQRNPDKRWTAAQLLEHPFVNPDNMSFRLMKIQL